MGPPGHRVGHDAVDTDGGQQQGAAKTGRKNGPQKRQKRVSKNGSRKNGKNGGKNGSA
jgi:hypothetical protein